MAENSRGSRAAQLAAGQVEAIVAAAQLAAEKIRVEAESDATDRRLGVEKEVERIVSEGLAEAEQVRSDATRDAEQLRSEAAAEAAKLRDTAKSETDALRTKAAQETAAQRKAAADEARAVRDTAKEEADEVRKTARDEAEKLVEDARKQALEVNAQARAEAQQRIAAARQAADDSLADARAISDGLHKLGDLLTGHSERILRDVTNAHRGMAANLRVAAADASAGPERTRPRQLERGAEPDEPANGNGESSGEGARERPRRSGAPEFDPPTWVDKA
jgi:vacuolar-type H+-ATPase subunit E/Vma4